MENKEEKCNWLTCRFFCPHNQLMKVDEEIVSPKEEKCTCGKCETCLVEIKESAIKKIEELTGEKFVSSPKVSEWETKLKDDFEKFCSSIPATYLINYSDGKIATGIDGATTDEVSNWWLQKISSLISSTEKRVAEEIVGEIEKNRKDPEEIKLIINPGFTKAYTIAYNEGIDDITNLIKSKYEN